MSPEGRSRTGISAVDSYSLHQGRRRSALLAVFCPPRSRLPKCQAIAAVA